jgi:hypothetical protein
VIHGFEPPSAILLRMGALPLGDGAELGIVRRN